MSDIIKYLSNLNKIHVVLVVLMVTYIVFPLPLPLEIAGVIDTNLGSLIVVVLSIFIFLLVNPVIGTLAFITGYVILSRAAISTGSEVMKQYTPGEDQKHQDMLYLHTKENGKSLEEETVDNMKTINHNSNLLSEDPYKPVYTSSKIDHAEIDM